MTTRSSTTYTYVCDLCGSENEEKLSALWCEDPAGASSGFRHVPVPSVDICRTCRPSRPIEDVFVYFEAQKNKRGR
jgi:hypothetical protein